MSLLDPTRLPILERLPAPYSHLTITGPGRKGGQGTVYPVFDEWTQRRRALKIYHRGHAPHGQDRNKELDFCYAVPVDLFSRVYETVVLGDDPSTQLFGFTMAFVDYTLQDLLELVANEKARLPEATVCRFIRQLAAAIDYMQGAGLVHRDLKPANVGLCLSRLNDPLSMSLGVTCAGESVADFRDAQLVVLDLGTLAENGSSPDILFRDGDRYKHKDLYPEVDQIANPAMDLFAFAQLLEDFRGLTEGKLEWLRYARSRCLQIDLPLQPGTTLSRLVSPTWKTQSELYASAGYTEEGLNEFEPREWAFAAFEQFRHDLQGKHGGVFLVHGPAGSGKSSLLRQWSQRLDQPQGYYFKDMTLRVDSEDMVNSLFGQLKEVLIFHTEAKRTETETETGIPISESKVIAARERTHEEIAADLDIPKLEKSPLESRLQAILDRITELPKGPSLLVLFIDALDEIRSSEEASIVIRALPKKLKPNVFLVLSSRPALPGWPFLDMLRTAYAPQAGAYREFDLLGEGNPADIIGFLARQLERDESDPSIQQLARQSGYLFLLAFYQAQAIKDRVFTLEQVLADSVSWMELAPEDRLKNYYRSSWNRITTHSAGPGSRTDPLLGVDSRVTDYCAAMLCVLGDQGIDENTLYHWLVRFTGEPRWNVKMVRRLNQLFIWFVEPSRPDVDRQGNPAYRVRHKSIRDFFTAGNGEIPLADVRAWHKRAAEYYLVQAGDPQARNWSGVDPYGQRHTVSHLLESLQPRSGMPGDFVNPDEWRMACRILTDWAYLSAVFGENAASDGTEPSRQLVEVLADYRNAVERFDPDKHRRTRLRQYLAEGGKPEELTDDRQLFYRLLKFKSFLRRNNDRIELCPDQLRVIALNGKPNSYIQRDVKNDFDRQPMRRPWLELIQPLETAPDLSVRRLLCRHRDWVLSVSWVPQGQRIVSASDDGTLIIWDAATGLQITTLKGHTDRVESASWDRQGQRIVSASTDGTLIIWDAATGLQITTLKGHRDLVYSASWDPQGQRIVSGHDGTLIIWDAATGLQITTLKGHTDRVYSASWDPQGQRIVSARTEETLIIWNAATGLQITTLKGHTDWVRLASWDLQGQRIVSASMDETLIVWDAATGQQISTLKGHTGWVNLASWDPLGQRIVTASADRTLIVWDVTSGKSLVRYPLEASGTTAEWNPTGNNELVVGHSNGWVWLYRFHEGRTPSINDW